MMNTRTNQLFKIISTTVLLLSLFAGVVNARNANPAQVSKASLSNVRDYAAALTGNQNYAIDGGLLYVGGAAGWSQVTTPDEVIVGAVALDPTNPTTIYIGAANELALYRSTDGGQKWLRAPLSNRYVGGVTDLAVDSDQRLVYVGTDTAGLFRLRDVGSSMVVGGHLQLTEPVLEVATTSNGSGMAFARTNLHLYRAENYGLAWRTVENLGSTPTALTLTNNTVYVGTMDRGLLKSRDGVSWMLANNGLGLLPGTRLAVTALSVDPQQPDVLYVATSYLYGTTSAHQSPVGVAMSNDSAASWSPLHRDEQTAITGLLPVSGLEGAVYAVSDVSRTPVALGKAAQLASASVTTVTSELASVTWLSSSLLAWLVAGLAALALLFALANDLRTRRLAAREALMANAGVKG
jgi:hypothetical protein